MAIIPPSEVPTRVSDDPMECSLIICIAIFAKVISPCTVGQSMNRVSGSERHGPEYISDVAPMPGRMYRMMFLAKPVELPTLTEGNSILLVYNSQIVK